MLDLIVIGVIDIHSIVNTSLKQGKINEISAYTEKFSGSALHVAVNASILETQVGIISPVGRDAVGLINVFKRYSIDYSHIILSSKKNPNFMEFITSTKHYQMYYPGAIEDMHPEKIKQEYIQDAKAIHVCFPDEKVSDHSVKMARKEHIFTSADAAFSSPRAAVVFSEEKKGKNTIFMDFKKGIVVNGKKIPVFTGSTYNESGVKDAFIAAFLSRYIKSENMEYAALYGSCAAYLCSQSEKKVLTCGKEELDTLFEEKKESLAD